MALLALRVSVGWHFYKEGAKKLNNPDVFTSAGFLRQATGPWAESFHGMARQPHDWDKLLAQPLENAPLSEEAKESRAKWENEQKEALASSEPPIRPFAPYAAYAERVAEDWKVDLRQLLDRSSAGEEARQAAAEKYNDYRRYLIGYFHEVAPEIEKYQHELWRLEGLKSSPTADELPFQQNRIAEKRAETSAMVAPWVAQVQALEIAFREEVGKLLGTEGAPVRLPPPSDQLSRIDRLVPYWHLAVGVGLVLGLFSRLAGAAGALFLAMVLATQPPWVAGAADTYYQVVEFAACLVLATIPTGRFAGLDFFVHSLVSRCCQRT